MLQVRDDLAQRRGEVDATVTLPAGGQPDGAPDEGIGGAQAHPEKLIEPGLPGSLIYLVGPRGCGIQQHRRRCAQGWLGRGTGRFGNVEVDAPRRAAFAAGIARIRVDGVADADIERVENADAHAGCRTDPRGDALSDQALALGRHAGAEPRGIHPGRGGSRGGVVSGRVGVDRGVGLPGEHGPHQVTTAKHRRATAFPLVERANAQAADDAIGGFGEPGALGGLGPREGYVGVLQCATDGARISEFGQHLDGERVQVHPITSATQEAS